MRKLFISIAFFLTVLGAQGQLRWNQQYQQYIDTYKDVAVDQMKRWKIPASITLAQGLLESGAGNSRLALKANNHFGIKCHDWAGKKFYKDDDRKNECFRSYSSAYESFVDHSRFLASGSRYSKLFSLNIKDYKGWAKGLKAAGYATNPKYANQLIDIIELYKLYQYDTTSTGWKISKKTLRKTGTIAYPVKMFNKNYYIVAKNGDTYRSLGKIMKVSYRRLAKYNERDKDDVLQDGDIVWLKRKRKNVPKEYKGRLHYIQAGESMYTISQRYGIRVEALYKLNKLSPDYQIKVGDTLKLR